MSNRQYKHQKRQRDLDKAAKKARKLQRRAEKASGEGSAEAPEDEIGNPVTEAAEAPPEAGDDD